MRNRRLKHRILAGWLIGLIVGWYVAGIVEPYLSNSVSFAASGGKGHDQVSEHASGNTAAALVPHDHQAPSWYRTLVLAIIGLFLAAIPLGWLALKWKAPDPPDPAEHLDHRETEGSDHGAHPQ